PPGGICAGLGGIHGHYAAFGRDASCSEYSDGGPAGKRKRNDLARAAVRARHQAVLPEDRTVPDQRRRPDEAEDWFATLHAPGVQRPHEPGGWFLAAHLCWPGGAAHRQPEAPAAKFAVWPGAGNRYPCKCSCFAYSSKWPRQCGVSRRTKSVWSIWPTRTAGNASRYIEFGHQ